MNQKGFVRPIAVIGLTFLVTLMAASELSLPTQLALAAFCLVAALLLSLLATLRMPKPALVLLTVAIALGILSIHTYFNYLPLLSLEGQQKTIVGTVTDLAVSEGGKQVITVQPNRDCVSTVRPIKMRIFSEEPISVRVADEISANTYCYFPSEQYGVYSPQDTAKADSIYLYGYARAGELTVNPVDGFRLSRQLYRFRETLKQKADALFAPTEAGFVKAVLFGDKSALSEEVYRDFTHTGTVHMLTVSGLHFVILSQFVIRTLKLFRLKRRARYAVGMAIIILFMGIAGFQPAVCRAGITLLLFYGARLFRRDADALTSLGLTGLLLAFINPYIVLSLSFQLTYLSTMGILLFAPKIHTFLLKRVKRERTLWRWASELLAMTFAATLTTLPVTAYTFQGISLMAPIWNLLLSPLFELILIGGLLIFGLAFLPYLSVVAEVLAAPLSLCIRAVNRLLSLGAAIPYSYLPLGYRYLYFGIVATALLFFIAFRYCHFRFKYLLTAALSAVILVGGTLTHGIVYRDVLNVAICTVGNDTAVLMDCREQSILFDCNSLIARLVDSNGIAAFPLAAEIDTTAALPQLSREVDLGVVIAESSLSPDAISCRDLRTPDNYDLRSGEELQIKVRVHGEKTYYIVEYGNVNIILGEYDEQFAAYHRADKENIYILVKDCDMVFQNPVNYVIMLNGINPEVVANHPQTQTVDGAAQGITPILVHKNGSVKIKGADKWLY